MYSLIFEIFFETQQQLVAGFKDLQIFYNKSYVTDNRQIFGMRKSLNFMPIAQKQLQLFFDLSLSQTDEDKWGISQDLIREVVVANHLETFISDYQYGVKIFLFVLRPVQVFKRVRYTVLDAILKIGGLLGIMKLVTIFIFSVHLRLFKQEISRECAKLSKEPIFEQEIMPAEAAHPDQSSKGLAPKNRLNHTTH